MLASAGVGDGGKAIMAGVAGLFVGIPVLLAGFSTALEGFLTTALTGTLGTGFVAGAARPQIGFLLTDKGFVLLEFVVVDGRGLEDVGFAVGLNLGTGGFVMGGRSFVEVEVLVGALFFGGAGGGTIALPVDAVEVALSTLDAGLLGPGCSFLAAGGGMGTRLGPEVVATGGGTVEDFDSKIWRRRGAVATASEAAIPVIRDNELG